jgi:hypothetical protein
VQRVRQQERERGGWAVFRWGARWDGWVNGCCWTLLFVSCACCAVGRSVGAQRVQGSMIA